MSDDETVVVSRRDNSIWVGLRRPQKRNALDLATSSALSAAISLAQEQGPAVLVLHSTTPGIFAAGTDVADLAGRSFDEAMTAVNVRLFGQLASFRWPTIAVVDGPALGGGCELALACDLRIVTPAARFAQPEPSLGIIAGAGANYRLPQLAGLAVARRMLYLGDTVDGESAVACGLADRLASSDTVLDAVEYAVASIVKRSWRALELTKLALRFGQQDTTALDLVAQALLYESDDTAARLHAFLNRAN